MLKKNMEMNNCTSCTRVNFKNPN